MYYNMGESYDWLNQVTVCCTKKKNFSIILDSLGVEGEPGFAEKYSAYCRKYLSKQLLCILRQIFQLKSNLHIAANILKNDQALDNMGESYDWLNQVTVCCTKKKNVFNHPWQSWGWGCVWVCWRSPASCWGWRLML